MMLSLCVCMENKSLHSHYAKNVIVICFGVCSLQTNYPQTSITGMCDMWVISMKYLMQQSAKWNKL